MKKIIIGAILLIIIFAGYKLFGLYSLNKPAPSGVYKLGKVTIKYIPPEGWKKIKDFSGNTSIQFMPSPQEFTTLRIEAIPASGYKGLSEEKIIERLLKDPTRPGQQVVTFASTKAATATTETSSIKDMSIQFVKDEIWYVIIFMTDKEKFDKLLPVIDESLKTFEIIKP